MDEQSLALRGKKSKVKSEQSTKQVLIKRKTPNESMDGSKTSDTTNKKIKIDLTNDDVQIDLTKEEDQDETIDNESKEEDRGELEAMIDSSEKSDFQKRCLKLLVQIPEGHFSTYGKPDCTEAFWHLLTFE